MDLVLIAFYLKIGLDSVINNGLKQNNFLVLDVDDQQADQAAARCQFQ